MPGTIQVSVLDFMDLQSSSRPSPMSIKVSMGKIEHQTWDKGDFTFPLTTLRDQLVVTLQDANGNEISHAGVETRLVIEKGVWDDTFPMEGGGHVRMKLQFVLSEDDRQRIRVMRELALKKKRDELLNSGLRSPQYAIAVDSSAAVASSSQPKDEVTAPSSQDPRKSKVQRDVVTPRVDLILTPSTSSSGRKSLPERRDETHSVQKQHKSSRYEETSSSTPVSQGFSAYPKEESKMSLGERSGTESPTIDVALRRIRSNEGLSDLAAKSKAPVKLKGVEATVTEKKSSPEKTPTKVRNMITAFESSLNQDMNPKIKPSPTNFSSKRLEEEIPLKGMHLSDVGKERRIQAQFLPGRTGTPFHTVDNQEVSAPIGKREEPAKATNVDLKNNELGVMHKADREKDKTSSEDLLRASTGKQASFSGRMHNVNLGTHAQSDLFARKQHSGGDLLIRNSGKNTHSKDLERVNIGRASGDGHSYFKCNGAWVFPDEGRRLCITTAGKQILNVMGGFWDEAKSQPIKFRVNEGTGSVELGKGESSQRHSNSIEGDTYRGPVSQVLRVAIMVGFATLVLFTRQKTR